MNPADKITHIDDPKVPKLGDEAPQQDCPSDQDRHEPEKRDTAAERRIRDLRKW